MARRSRPSGRRWITRMVLVGGLTGGLAAIRKRKIVANTRLYGLP